MSMVTSQKHVAKRQCRRATSMWKSDRVIVPQISASARQAFTLVELLVVIGILAILAALITPAIFQARVSARNAAIKAEIDMLHMAIMNYKNEYGSFPPSYSVGAGGAAESHVKRIFPRFTGTISNSTSPLNAIANWLRGFSSNPVDPLGAGRKKLYDFDQSRLAGDVYYASGKPKSPYIYFSNTDYDKFDSVTGVVSLGWPQSDQSYVVGSSTYTVSALTFAPQEDGTGNRFNSDTFQILCAGLDEQWGTEDDLSNFWKGTRQDYLDSLE